jgi:Fe-S cluster biogenesis protein NfuA
VKVVVDKVKPQLATNGGNVFMLQIENEYVKTRSVYLSSFLSLSRGIES